MDLSVYEKKAEALVAEMTVEEAAGQLTYQAAEIARLGVPAYNWWNEALHGVARAGTATVFPQAIGLAAAFDPPLIGKIADVIATEGRAKYNQFVAENDRTIYKGLTYWSPNVNIFRDPRWGRGQETYGEDPYLTSELGTAFVHGMQGDGKYYKAVACAKHFAVHSGPEAIRHEFDAEATPKDMEETYLYAFEKLVKAGVGGVMGAYNRLNGEPCCAHTFLQKKLKEWGFKGYFTSDCWAIADFHMHHHVTSTAPESAALALKNGCDLNCGNVYLQLLVALKEGLIEEEDIRRSCRHLMTIRFALGMGEETEFDRISYSEVESKKHLRLARTAAEKSVVLLKNNGILPLEKKKYKGKTIAVIGPAAASEAALYGNYCGTGSACVTLLEGIRKAYGDSHILYAKGSHMYKDIDEDAALPDDKISEAVICAKRADVVILCVGLDATLEGEEGCAPNFGAAGDKLDLNLPPCQMRLVQAVLAAGTPTVIVQASGSSIVSGGEEAADAILQAWYPGELGGEAVARILRGKVNPSGKLPVTFYKNCDDLPAFTDYSMKNRTYTGYEGKPFYPFGYGLSYTSFKVEKAVKRGSGVSVTVKNTGDRDGETVMQVYRKIDHPCAERNRRLVGFLRIFLKKGDEKQFRVPLSRDCLRLVGEDGVPFAYVGKYELIVEDGSGAQPFCLQCTAK